jgi:hypothetical protein
MIAVVTFIAGGVFVAVLGVVARLMFGPHHAPEPTEPKPVCGCAHHLALHDPRTTKCHGSTKRPSRWNRRGETVGYEHVPCECRHYVGPTPVDTFFSTARLFDSPATMDQPGLFDPQLKSD